MKVSLVDNDIVVENVKCFDLELTLDCGQAFRWVKEKDASFSGVVKGVFLNISKQGDTLIFKDTTKEDFYNIWKDYFDLDRDYAQICNTLKQDSLLRETVDRYYGIRILNQDSWEALVSFVISQQNNIKRIKGILQRLCEAYGKEVSSGYYSFPDPQTLSKLTVKDFEALGTGYRGKYLFALSQKVANGEIDLEKIKTLSLDDARKELLNIYGVGIKVANCALLFGFGFLSAFPVDVWMKRVMEFYPDGLPQCFEGIEGIAQQYLFHWARNNLN